MEEQEANVDARAIIAGMQVELEEAVTAKPAAAPIASAAPTAGSDFDDAVEDVRRSQMPVLED